VSLDATLARVARRLVEVLATLTRTAVEAVGAGYSIAKRECDNHSGGQRMLCDAIGHRIEIRLLDTD
jgi:regulator of RNase E activity RraB